MCFWRNGWDIAWRQGLEWFERLERLMNSVIRNLDVCANPLRVVQITDTHLYRREGGTLLGMDTDRSLQRVIDLVRTERPTPDVLLGTGDISDHGSEAAYVRARDYFGQLVPETFWLVGNHDHLAHMENVLGTDGILVRVVYGGNWQIVLLNSQIPGQAGGALGADELDWLETCLREAASRECNSLICLHHQPVPVGSVWIDPQRVQDSTAFFAITDRYPLVRGILWGHVHQSFDQERNGVRLMSTPSSCVQFAPASEVFKIDDVNPGYRWLELYADGGMQSGISRVRGPAFAVNLEAGGYR